jgi:single stranded DNA-binding protein
LEERVYENITTIVGNVATDIRTASTRSGAPVATFRVASTTRNKGGWADTDTNWFTVICFRQLAANVISCVERGQPVVVQGRLKQREWKDGDTRGIANEIEAYVVGHDLNRGTSSFERAHAPEPVADDREDVVVELSHSFVLDDLVAQGNKQVFDDEDGGEVHDDDDHDLEALAEGDPEFRRQLESEIATASAP